MPKLKSVNMNTMLNSVDLKGKLNMNFNTSNFNLSRKTLLSVGMLSFLVPLLVTGNYYVRNNDVSKVSIFKSSSEKPSKQNVVSNKGPVLIDVVADTTLPKLNDNFERMVKTSNPLFVVDKFSKSDSLVNSRRQDIDVVATTDAVLKSDGKNVDLTFTNKGKYPVRIDYLCVRGGKVRVIASSDGYIDSGFSGMVTVPAKSDNYNLANTKDSSDKLLNNLYVLVTVPTQYDTTKTKSNGTFKFENGKDIKVYKYGKCELSQTDIDKLK